MYGTTATIQKYTNRHHENGGDTHNVEHYVWFIGRFLSRDGSPEVEGLPHMQKEIVEFYQSASPYGLFWASLYSGIGASCNSDVLNELHCNYLSLL